MMTGLLCLCRRWLCVVAAGLGCVAAVQLAVAGTVIRFGHPNTTMGLPARMAQLDRAFERAGIQVEFHALDRGQLIREALIAERIDIGQMTDTTFLTLAARGLPVKAIAVSGYGGDRYRVMVRPDAPYRTLEDLRGRKVANQVGSGVDASFRKALTARGLTPGDFEIVNMRWPDMPAALSAGLVDAIVSCDPWTVIAAEKGLARSILKLGAYTHSPNLLVARTSLLEKAPGEVRVFLQVLGQVERGLREEPERGAEALRAWLEGRNIRIGDASALDLVTTVIWDPRLTPEILRGIRDEAVWQVREGRLRPIDDLRRFVDTEIVEDALRN